MIQQLETTATLATRPGTPADQPWIREQLTRRWGSCHIVTRGQVHNAVLLPALLAELAGRRVGLATYHPAGEECELVTLDSFLPGRGVGAQLIAAVKGAALAAGCRRLWLITTNDNLNALRFYQKQGFVLAALYPNAIAQSRQLKPEIPLIGEEGIPIRDELLLTIPLAAR